MVECYLCKSSKEDDIQYGEMLQNENMAVHTFCLYLSSNLLTNGKDDEGFLGFLETDIRKEARRVSLLHCCYCHNAYANVGCCEKKCRRSFHFVCGLENRAENQFCGSFKSYCNQHVRKSISSRPPQNVVCVICYDNLQGAGERFNHITMIPAPCCRNGWFHKICLQRFAKTAGYFFKCPLCNDAQTFREKLSFKGIFIPNQDAAWELEPNAFAELLERPNECAATKCHCRTYSSSSNPFIFCSTCGSTAMHSRCIPHHLKRFQCADCTVAQERDSGRGSLNTHADNNENDEEIDVCDVSDKEDLAIIQGLLQANGPQREDNDKRAHSSCSSEDEEIKLTRRRRLRLVSRDSNCSGKSKENRPPASRSRSSSSSDDGSNISFTMRRNRKLRRDRVVRDSMSSEEDFVKSSARKLRHKMEEDEAKIIQEPSPECCTSSKENEKTVKKRKQTVEKEFSSTTEDSSSELSYPGIEDRNRTCISTDEVEIILIDKESDDDDDDLNHLEKNTQVETKTSRTLASDSPRAELSSSEESDDPLENFTKIMERQKNISCIAQRTRTKSVSAENPHPFNMQIPPGSSREDKKNSFQAEDQSKPIKSQKSLAQEKYNTSLDISCIARRTRRKSMYCKSSEMSTQANPSKYLSSNQTRNSPSATHRRKTVCSETTAEKNKKQHKSHQDVGEIKMFLSQGSSQSTTTNKTSFYEMSQIYGKEYDTDEETGLHAKMQETHSNVLEISCIANRTRKRKFIKMQNITEEDESAPSSCSSSFSNKPAFTNFQSNYGSRRRQRILSISSEDTENVYEDTTSTQRYNNDKWPKQTYTAFKNTKLRNLYNSSSYYPSNLHHPHINNRKRV